MTEQTGFSGRRRTTQRIGAVYGGNRFSVLRTRLAACVETCDYYQATALYNEVSGISDAELHRGLSLPSSAKRATEATADCGNRNYDCRHRTSSHVRPPPCLRRCRSICRVAKLMDESGRTSASMRPRLGPPGSMPH